VVQSNSKEKGNMHEEKEKEEKINEVETRM
jgi:hypothetical protein